MTDGEFELEFMTAIAESNLDIAARAKNEKLRLAKEEAIKIIGGRCRAYRDHGYDQKLVLAVLKKKLALLKGAERIADVSKIKKPSAPSYHGGGRFMTDETWVAEEELIQWSLASLRAPLAQDGYERFLMLVRQFYGEIPPITNFYEKDTAMEIKEL